MAHSSLTLGAGHEIYGSIEAVSVLQSMILKGAKPAGLQQFQASPVEATDPTDKTVCLSIGRHTDGTALDIHGSMAAVSIAQAWYLANPSFSKQDAA
jgi:hypothetical protein